MPHRNLLLSAQRAVVARAALSMLRNTCTAYFKHERLGERIIDIIIGYATMIGHAEGKPMTASDISEFIGTPRATVIRRLHVLKDEGFIERRREGKRITVVVAGANDPRRIQQIIKNMELTSKTFHNLSKMNTPELAKFISTYQKKKS